MIFLGWLVVIGLPLVVIVGAICWPERIPLDRTGETEADEGRHRPRSSPCSGTGPCGKKDCARKAAA